MISKINHVKFAHFVLLAISEEAKASLLFFFHSMSNKIENNTWVSGDMEFVHIDIERVEHSEQVRYQM